MSVYTCRIVLYNRDLEVKWRLKDNKVELISVYMLFSDSANLLEFISHKVIKLIIEHIEFYELGKDNK